MKPMRLEVGLEVLGGGMTSRLYQSLVEQQQLAISAASYAWSDLHDPGPAVISASPAPGVSMDDLETAVMARSREGARRRVYGKRKLFGPGTSWLQRRFYARDSQSTMANVFGSSTTLAIGGTIEDVLSYPDNVRAITPEEAIAAVRTVLRS
jgi:zinc protease